jgi:16S rRNA (guanine527-N7)-methyltransferase
MTNKSNLFATLQSSLQKMHIDATADTKNKLLDYIELLIKWNRIYNLTAEADHQEILAQHILDSLSIVPYIKGSRVLDFGTGAGLPGIPLALILPDYHFVLLDSIGKKIRFLQQAVAELGISNVEIVQQRAEKYHPSACFATIVARAIGSVSDIIALTERLLCPQGALLLMKGRDPKDELTGISWEYQIIPLQVPELNKERHLVYLRKSA